MVNRFKFKIGDKVEVYRNLSGGSKGYKGTIVSREQDQDPDDKYPSRNVYRIKENNGDKSKWSEENLRLAKVVSKSQMKREAVMNSDGEDLPAISVKINDNFDGELDKMCFLSSERGDEILSILHEAKKNTELTKSNQELQFILDKAKLTSIQEVLYLGLIYGRRIQLHQSEKMKDIQELFSMLEKAFK